MHLQGKWPEAEQAERKALELLDREATIGGFARAACMVRLAGYLTNQGKYEEAEELSREAHSIYDSTLGPSHLTTLAALHGLALFLKRTGRCVPLYPTP